MIDLENETEDEGSDLEIVEQPTCQPLVLNSFFKFNEKSLIHEKFDYQALTTEHAEQQTRVTDPSEQTDRFADKIVEMHTDDRLIDRTEIAQLANNCLC